MKTEQMELPLDKFATLADIKVGECFTSGSNTLILMRVAPVKSLVHSTMVHEVLTRGDCFVANLTTGQLTVMKYNTPVTKLQSKLIYTPA